MKQTKCSWKITIDDGFTSHTYRFKASEFWSIYHMANVIKGIVKSFDDIVFKIEKNRMFGNEE